MHKRGGAVTRTVASRSIGGGVPSPADSAREARTRSALVAESDAETRRLVARVLRQDGFSVIEATDGRWAIRRLFDHRGRLDLLVTDLQTPDLNGLQVAAMVTIARPETAVVLMIADPSTLGDREESLPGQVLHKPFSADELRAAIAAARVPAR